MIVLINPFEVPSGTSDEEFLSGWDEVAQHLRTQPGFGHATLHRAIRPDARFRFINVAEWQSPEAFMAAVSTEEFRRMASRETSQSHPALYQVVRSIGVSRDHTDATDAG